MNYITNEQADVLMNHVKFMMSTNKFDFIIYFLNKLYINTENISRVPNYSFNIEREFDKFIRFNNINQIEYFVAHYFKDNADFFNQFNAVLPAQETNPFTDAMEYFEKEFNDKYSDNFASWVEKSFQSENHLLIFNFVYKNCNDNNIFKELNPYNRSFYDNNLTDDEKEYFKNIYLAKNNLNNTQYQLEHSLSSNLCNYRLGCETFDTIKYHIDNFESLINNFVMPVYHAHEILKYGKDHRFENAIKEFAANLINNLSNKKVQFDKAHCANDNDLIEIQYDKFTFNRYREDSNNEIKKVILAELPDMTEKMLSNYYVCKLNFQFKEPLTMQVKNTFKHKLYNYMINHNIKPINYKLQDNNKATKPATGLDIEFICDMYESIGINPIKFMIPKLSMHK